MWCNVVADANSTRKFKVGGSSIDVCETHRASRHDDAPMTTAQLKKILMTILPVSFSLDPVIIITDNKATAKTLIAAIIDMLNAGS